MRILSIDSSLGTQVAVVDAVPSAAGARALQVLSQDEQADTRRHAESLGQMLSQALSAPEVAERPLDAVVAATGPAPFTGLRAGLVTAGVVGRTRGVPVHGVSSLDAVARRALDELGAQEGQTGPVVLVATDARRREVYTALFRANGPDDVTRLTRSSSALRPRSPSASPSRHRDRAGGVETSTSWPAPVPPSTPSWRRWPPARRPWPTSPATP